MISNPQQIKLPSADIWEMNLTPEEQNLYMHHVRNWREGKVVQQPGGGGSTILQFTREINGRTYNLPSVWDGKVLSIEDATKRAIASGLTRWPSYPDEQTAQKRYDQMHSYMEQDMSHDQ